MSEVPLDKVKSSMRNSWMAGDFGIIARTISGAAEDFAARIPFAPGARILDVATGSGNVAIPLGRRGAIVTGVDIAPNLLTQARERATAETLTITFDEGDAEQLPYPDASFDVVATMFGAMFAPRPELVASELARVLIPGGTLAMANWNPASFTGKMFKLGSQHVPPAHTFPPPVLWGDISTASARLAPYFTNITSELISVDFDLPFSPASSVDFFRKYFGPTQVAFSRLDEQGQAAFAADLETLWSTHNTSPTPTTHTLIPNEYLQIIATRS